VANTIKIELLANGALLFIVQAVDLLLLFASGHRLVYLYLLDPFNLFQAQQQCCLRLFQNINIGIVH
jgi:hypothetical protein